MLQIVDPKIFSATLRLFLGTLTRYSIANPDYRRLSRRRRLLSPLDGWIESPYSRFHP
jgi:hypothetical protein